MRFSVIMPALNEEDNIVSAADAVMRGFDGSGLSGELLIVDDGSSDRTLSLARELAENDSRIRVIHHDSPRGMGGAFWQGVGEAREEFVVMIPGDNENDPGDIFRFARLGELVDIIVPFVCNKHVRTRFRRFVSFLYRSVINLSFGTNFNYTNGTVIYNRNILKGLNLYSNGFFYQTELLVQLVRRGYLYAEVPTLLRGRHAGKQKAITLRAFTGVVKAFLRLLWRVRILRRLPSTIETESVTYRTEAAHDR